MKTKRARVKDFEERAKADPDAVHSEPEIGRYFAVHPMADETALLKRLGIDASACKKVDLFWRRKDDVLFVQVEGSGYSVARTSGYYARKAPSGYLNIVAVISDDVVTSNTVRRVLAELATRPIAVRTLSDTLQLL